MVWVKFGLLSKFAQMLYLNQEKDKEENASYHSEAGIIVSQDMGAC
jgi:hypothetical protein